jgi:hypothetical protein
MTSPSIIRRAVPEDRESIWTLLKLLHAENGVGSISEHKVNWLLDRVLYPESIPEGDMGPRGYMGVIGPVGQVEGMVLLNVGSYWYSDEPLLQEMMNFVHPNHRKSNHAKTLLSWGRYMSDKTGVPLLIGVLSNTRTEAKVRLYRRFLPEAGAFFLYNATTGALGTNGERPAIAGAS